LKNKGFIFNILNLEKGEGLLVLLPMVYSFFAGASLAFFVTSSTALFLNIFERDMLSIAFIASGAIVWMVGQIFSGVQKKYDFTKSLTSGVGFLFISIVIFILFFLGSKHLIIIFILYAWIRVFSFMHAVTFWGMAGRLFSLRQGKRVFGLISGGEVIASIISFFSVPFLLKLISTEDLLLISGIALLIGFLLMLFIVNKFRAKLSDPNKKSKAKIGNQLNKKTSFLQNRYYKLFFVIAFIPIFAQFFIDFIFQAQAKIEYPDKEAITAFVGIFFGISSIIEFFLKTFVSGRLMARYGMKFALLAFPVVLIFSVSLATIFGFVYGAFSLFFSFVALGRLFTRAVRTSFNDPATQILFQPLPVDERISFQNKVESGPKAFASIAAGVLLFLFAKIPGFSLVYFSAFLLLVIIFWAKSAVEIYKEYRIELQGILSAKREEQKSIAVHPLLSTLNEMILSGNYTDLPSYIKFCRLVYPYECDKVIQQNKEVYTFLSLDKPLKFNDVIELSKSENPPDRIVAAKHLSDYSIYKIEKPLTRLLHDDNFDVRCEAVITSGRMKETDLFYHLVSLFQNPIYMNIVSAAMIHIGEAILSELDQNFQKTEYDIGFQLKIIELAEKIGGEKTIDFLKRNINHPNNAVSAQIIKSLGILEYKSNLSESIIVWQKIENEIKNFVYITSAIVNLKQSPDNEEIIAALEHEKIEKKKKIFSLLSVLYDSHAINLIAYNLESADKDAKGFALEIADIIFSEFHKPILSPLMESEFDEEIINKYKYHFPTDKLDVIEQLIDILNSEYWVTGLYIKSLAIKILSNFSDIRIMPILIGNMVHPHPMMRQLASYYLYKKDKNQFEKEVNKNFPKAPGLKNFASEINTFEIGTKSLIYGKLKKLKNLEIFSGVYEEELIEISTKSIEIIVESDNLLTIAGNSNEYIIPVEGELIEYQSNKKIRIGNIICPFLKPDEQTFNLIAISGRAVLLRINIYLVTNLMVNNKQFAQNFIFQIWQKNNPVNIEPKDKILTGTENDIKEEALRVV